MSTYLHGTTVLSAKKQRPVLEKAGYPIVGEESSTATTGSIWNKKIGGAGALAVVGIITGIVVVLLFQ